MSAKTIISIVFIVAILGFVGSYFFGAPGGGTASPETATSSANGEGTSPRIASALVGTYSSPRLPAQSTEWRAFTLTLGADGTAVFTRELPNTEPRVETGTWGVDSGIVVVDRDTGSTLRFAARDGSLSLTEFDMSEWGSAGVTLTRPETIDENSSATSSVAGTIWQWQQTVRGGVEVVPRDPAAFSLIFSPDGSLAAETDCNTLRGRYSVALDRSLTLSAVGTTRMACPDAQGPRFLADLRSADRFRRDGDTLILELSGGGQLEFVSTGSAE